MNKEKSSNMSEEDTKIYTDKDEINSDCVEDNCGKIYEDCVKEKFIILRILKKLLKCLSWISMVKIFLKPFNCIINIFRKYIFHKTTQKPFQNEQDILVIIIFSFLLIILFIPISQNNYLYKFLAVFFGIWRLIDIFSYQLSIIFPSKGNYAEPANVYRSILLWIINLMEIITIYAIFYFTTQGIIIEGSKNSQLIKPLEALYFSIITISTTGFGDIIPKKGWGQFWASTEIIVGIFMLIVFFGILISKWKDKDDIYHDLLNEVYKQKHKE